MSTPETTPTIHEVLGYDDADLATERRYLSRRDAHKPTRPLTDPTARAAMRPRGEDPRLPQAPRYVWKGTK